MHSPTRSVIALLAGAGLLLAEIAVSRLLPLLGSIFYLPTVIWLSVLEDAGYATLQGSPDGWPIPTELGWVVSAASWWLVWSTVAALFMWRSRSRRAAMGVSNPTFQRTASRPLN